MCVFVFVVRVRIPKYKKKNIKYNTIYSEVNSLRMNERGVTNIVRSLFHVLYGQTCEDPVYIVVYK